MRAQLQRATIFFSGILGPYTATSLGAIIPTVAEDFGISISRAAILQSVYLFPFAGMMLFSSRLVRRLPPNRVVAISTTSMLVCTIVLLLSPDWRIFAFALAMAGMSNAFLMPVLQSMLSAVTPVEQLGSALGRYASMQALGLLSSPAVAGFAALYHWQLVYALPLLVALWGVIVRTPETDPLSSRDDPAARVDKLLVLRSVLTCLAIGLGIIGMSFLVALNAQQRFDLRPDQTGLLIMSGGLAAFFFARRIGGLADKVGARVVQLLGLAVAAVVIGIISVVPSVWMMAVCWAVATLAMQGIQSSVNLGILRSPAGSSVLSTVLAFRFIGVGLAPVLMLPVYQASNIGAFATSAGILVVALVMNLYSAQRAYRRKQL